MDDRTFFDILYAMWAKTTGAQDHYWMPEKLDPESDDAEDWQLFAVSEDQSRKHLASYLSGEDADFITAVHGCLPDLIRRLHSALDEADRLDLEKDDLVNRVGALELEADEFTSIIKDLTEQISDLESGRV